jgi:hypothetical protein
MACNIGLFSVLTVLASSEISAAIGFGLFGVLSIIRLRSSEYDNIHIAYFFVSIAIALVTSLETHPLALSIGFVSLLVSVMAIFDNGYLRQQTLETELVLDQLFVDQELLKSYLEKTLNCTVIAMQIDAINYLNETTRVTLSYQVNKSQV